MSTNYTTELDHVLMALTIWREASGEGIQGMRAVAWVVLNRCRARHLPVRRIVTEPFQFSSMTIKGDAATTRWPQMIDTSFEDAWKAMVDVLGDNAATNLPQQVDPTQGATFYRNPATATSGWFDEAIKNGTLVKTVTIGHHDFYRPKES
jgi:N-acetylmuramoyl-L-alanine amidase